MKKSFTSFVLVAVLLLSGSYLQQATAATATNIAPTVSPGSVQSSPNAYTPMQWSLATYGVYPVTILNLTYNAMYVNFADTSHNSVYTNNRIPAVISWAGPQYFGQNNSAIFNPLMPQGYTQPSLQPFVRLDSSSVAKGGFKAGFNQNNDWVNPFLWFPSWYGTKALSYAQYVNTFGTATGSTGSLASALPPVSSEEADKNYYNVMNTTGTSWVLDMGAANNYSALTFMLFDGNNTKVWQNALRLNNGGLNTAGYQPPPPSTKNVWEIFRDVFTLGMHLVDDTLNFADPNPLALTESLKGTAMSVTALCSLESGGSAPFFSDPYPGMSNPFTISFQTMQNMPASIPAGNGYIYCSMVLPIAKSSNGSYQTTSSKAFISENQASTSGKLNAGTPLTRNQYVLNSGKVQENYGNTTYTMEANLFAVGNFSGVGNGVAQQTIGSSDQLVVMILNEGIFDAYSWLKYKESVTGVSDEKTFLSVNYPKLVKYFLWIDQKHPLDSGQIISLIGIEASLTKQYKEKVNLAQQGDEMATISSLLSRYYLEYCTANGIDPNDEVTGLGLIFADTVGNNSEGKNPNQTASSNSTTTAPSGWQTGAIQPIPFN